MWPVSLFRSIGIALSALLAPVAALAAEGQPTPGEIGMQDSVTPIADSIHVFHNGILLWTAILVSLLVLVLLAIIVLRFNARANPIPARFTHNTLIEVVWTVLPVDHPRDHRHPVLRHPHRPADDARWAAEVSRPQHLLVRLGRRAGAGRHRQGHRLAVVLDLRICRPAEELRQQHPRPKTTRLAQTPVQPRLLAVDNMLVVPVNATVRVQVTAADVIHAFAVPSFGIITDAVPGRLNETWFNARKEGVFYGQCRELCGKDHAYMPIAVRVVSAEVYAAWMAALAEPARSPTPTQPCRPSRRHPPRKRRS